MDDKIQELKGLLSRYSITNGNFTLASGATSHYYCDTKKTTLSPRGSVLVGEILYPMLSKLSVEAVGGLAMGSVFISTAVSIISELHGSPIASFFIRPKPKDHGLKHVVEQSYHPSGSDLLSPGRRVAIVDDVVTKGGSILKAIDEIEGLGCKIVAVLAIVDRCAGGGDLLRQRGLPYESLFETDEMGGLHINERGREAAGLTSIRAVS
jgi:orotate phosphoribosyltransferase